MLSDLIQQIRWRWAHRGHPHLKFGTCDYCHRPIWVWQVAHTICPNVSGPEFLMHAACDREMMFLMHAGSKAKPVFRKLTLPNGDTITAMRPDVFERALKVANAAIRDATVEH